MPVPMVTTFDSDGTFSEFDGRHQGNWTEDDGSLVMTYTSLHRGRPLRPKKVLWTISEGGKQLTLKSPNSSVLLVYERVEQ